MSDHNNSNPTCLIVGASHAGVNFAFALRREGWPGYIVLFDADPELPYHRPPLSKTYLSGEDHAYLKPQEAYENQRIELHTGILVTKIKRPDKSIVLSDGSTRYYHKLVIATGGRPIIPPFKGLKEAINLFPLRTAGHAGEIRKAILAKDQAKVVVIGGGYIGLETAASLRKMGAEVVVLEREERVLARVTAPAMSAYFEDLHGNHGVSILTGKNVREISATEAGQFVLCDDGTNYEADLILVGVGININTELASSANLAINGGIEVGPDCQTSDKDIYAIGDCTIHYNPHYGRNIRLESVQNAMDQATVAAKAIMGKGSAYDTIPWFWSDQHDVKLQLVGLSEGYDEVVLRIEPDGVSRSAWYFRGEELLAVDAVNNGKAYVLGTKFIKGKQRIDKGKLADPSEAFKPANLLLS